MSSMAPTDLILGSPIGEMLDNNRPKLQEIINMSTLMGHLQAAGVVDKNTRDTIQSKAAGFQQVSTLIDHLLTGDVKRYNDFVQALIDTNHEAVVNHLNSKLQAAPAAGGGAAAAYIPQGSKQPAQVGLEELAEQIDDAIKKELVYLKGTGGLAIDGNMIDHLEPLQVFPEQFIRQLKETGDTHKRLTLVLDKFRQISDAEKVLFCHALIQTGQRHHLKKIGIDVERITQFDVDSLQANK